MKSKIKKIISNQDHETKLQLQRELIYRQSLEQDEWVNDFFREIKSQNSFAKLLANHISDMTRFLYTNELTQWNIDEIKLVSSSLSNISSSMSFSLERILKSLSRKIRIKKAINDVQLNLRSIRFAANLYDVSPIIISRKMKNKFTFDKFSRSSLLTFDEKKAFLNFIDDYIQLRFSKHLAQDRYWNFDDEIFEKWFALFKKTIEKNSISSERMFNMNEKDFLIRIAEFVSKVIVSRSAKNTLRNDSRFKPNRSISIRMWFRFRSELSRSRNHI
jgi:hypothetical protein